MIPYSRQTIEEDDIKAVTEALKSDFLTTGPKIAEFEAALAKYAGVKYAVVMNSCTSALHAAMYAANTISNVFLPSLTFAGTLSAVLKVGAMPYFITSDHDTMLINLDHVEKALSNGAHAKVLITVDYAGQPCDYDRIYQLSQKYGLVTIADAAHSFGGLYNTRRVGSLAHMTCLSFHAVKSMTTGEGGAVLTDYEHLADKVRLVRNHFVEGTPRKTIHKYAIHDFPGYNYRMTSIQAALGISQLNKLDTFIQRRAYLSGYYKNRIQWDSTLCEYVQPLKLIQGRNSAYHLFVVKLDPKVNRQKVVDELYSQGIQTNLHYQPLHTLFQDVYRAGPELSLLANEADRLLSLPLYPNLETSDVDNICTALLVSVRNSLT